MTLTHLDSSSTFTASHSGTTNHDVQPSAGEVWLVLVWAKITSNGDGSDDLYIKLSTDDGDTETLTSHLNSSEADVYELMVVSNDCYIRLTASCPNLGSGNRTVTYGYQGWKIT